jgi:hypothetical protein
MGLKFKNKWLSFPSAFFFGILTTLAMEDNGDGINDKNEIFVKILTQLKENPEIKERVFDFLRQESLNNENNENKKRSSPFIEEENINSLNIIERETFLKLFNSSNGGCHFMDFSDERFGDFFMKVVKINIFDDKYINQKLVYTSKINRLKKFLDIEPNKTIGILLEAMLEKSKLLKSPEKLMEEGQLYENAEKVINRLLNGKKRYRKNDVPEGMYN